TAARRYAGRLPPGAAAARPHSSQAERTRGRGSKANDFPCLAALAGITIFDRTRVAHGRQCKENRAFLRERFEDRVLLEMIAVVPEMTYRSLRIVGMWAFAASIAALMPRSVFAACPQTDLGSQLPVSVTGNTITWVNQVDPSCAFTFDAPDATFLWTAPAAGT